MVNSLIKPIEEKGFSELFMKDGKTKVIEFFEAKSGTCEMMLPVMETASVEFKDRVQFFRMEVGSTDNLILDYHINRTPFFLIIYGDEIIDSMAGLVPMSRFFRTINMNIR